jgi:hypothetical protein
MPALDIILWKCGGPRYRVRDGRLAVVLESNMIMATGEHIWQGRVGTDFVEWRLDGTHHGGDASLDLIAPVATATE